MTTKERRDAIQAELHAEYKRRLEYRLLTQKAQEQSLKIGAMMRYLFGKVCGLFARLLFDRNGRN